jgi:hypothetical protein
MLGNVREWVQDWYGSYSAAAQTDPTGPPSSPFLQKVARGGGFLSPILETRTFGRSALSMDSAECFNGFRAAKSAVPSGIAPYEGVLRLEGDPMLESSWRQLGGATAGQAWSSDGPSLQAIDSGPFRGLYLVGNTWSESEGGSPSVVRLTGSVELGYSWQSAIDADSFPKWSLSFDLTVSTIASWRDQMVLGGGWLGGVGKLPAPEFDSLVLWAEGENSWIPLPATLSLQQSVFAITDGLPCEPGASCPGGWQPVNAESAVAGAIFPTGTQNGRYRALARVQGNWSEISSSSASSQDIGFNGPTYALAASAGGSLGNRIFAGGAFTNIDGNAAARVAGWNGSSWQALAGGFNDTVWSLATHESGGVNRLIAGGQFTQSGGAPLARIAQWNGSNWQPLGAGFDDGVVKVVRVLDDGSGPAIFAGGTFTRSGGLTRNGVAKWNGSSWQPLGSGITGSVSALEQVTFGGRRLIVAGGSFVQPGSPGLNRIAAWDALDGQWRPLGAGFNAPVSSLAVCNTAEGTRLVAGGQFTTADGQPVQRFAVWDGVGWSAEGTSLSDTPWAMLLMDEGSSPKLALAGSFQAGPSGTNRYAEWSFCPGQCPSDIDGDAQINASDLSLLLVGWGGSGTGDIDGNGAVDAGDLGRLLADWGPCP